MTRGDWITNWGTKKPASQEQIIKKWREKCIVMSDDYPDAAILY
jgi:hypothetical protein